MSDMPEMMLCWPEIGGGISAADAAKIGNRDADDTEYLRADLARARVAAAYEAAAEMLIDLGHVSESGETLAQEVRALVPDDARAALDRLLDEARAQEREACAEKADVLAEACEVLAQAAKKAGRKDDARWHGEAMRTAKDIARAIRARGAAQEGEG